MCKNGDKEFCLKKDFFDSIGDFNLFDKINKISPRPVIFIQGSNDKKVLPIETKLLFQSVQEPKKIYFIKSAKHSFVLFEEELFEITIRNLISRV